MTDKEKAVCILSGGMDSTTLVYDIVSQGKEVIALSFDYGQKHNRELKMAQATCEKLGLEHKILPLGVLNQTAPSALTRSDWNVPEGHYAADNMKQTVVPNRNMVMLSLAASFAIGRGIKDLYYGAHEGDFNQYPDCRPIFVEKMKDVLKTCDYLELDLNAPYINITKRDIARKGLELGVDYSLTQTCYNGKEEPCMKCGSCVERTEAFYVNEARDPLYDEKKWSEAVAYMKQVCEK